MGELLDRSEKLISMCGTILEIENSRIKSKPGTVMKSQLYKSRLEDYARLAKQQDQREEEEEEEESEVQKEEVEDEVEHSQAEDAASTGSQKKEEEQAEEQEVEFEKQASQTDVKPKVEDEKKKADEKNEDDTEAVEEVVDQGERSAIEAANLEEFAKNSKELLGQIQSTNDDFSKKNLEVLRLLDIVVRSTPNTSSPFYILAKKIGVTWGKLEKEVKKESQEAKENKEKISPREGLATQQLCLQNLEQLEESIIDCRKAIQTALKKEAFTFKRAETIQDIGEKKSSYGSLVVRRVEQKLMGCTLMKPKEWVESVVPILGVGMHQKRDADNEETRQLTVELQVKQLIREAILTDRLARMYEGWLPWV